jgi:glucosamine-phosphate N-acetyltransferase
MSEIQYIQLLELLNEYPESIEIIKYKYLNLLSELTSVSNIETSIFEINIARINEMGCIIIGIMNTPLNVNFEIIASGTIIIEPKIIREGKNVGHIEDIVVAKHMRGKGIGSKIIHFLKLLARECDCYKVILDCKDETKNVYIKNGFEVNGLQMAQYF